MKLLSFQKSPVSSQHVWPYLPNNQWKLSPPLYKLVRRLCFAFLPMFRVSLKHKESEFSSTTQPPNWCLPLQLWIPWRWGKQWDLPDWPEFTSFQNTPGITDYCICSDNAQCKANFWPSYLLWSNSEAI